jgi:hypothetical protein
VRWSAFWVGLGLVLSTMPSRTEAGFIPTSIGNTAPTSGRVMSTVDFAVLDTDGGNTGDTWGTGCAGFDNTFQPGKGSPALVASNFLYFYQITNDWPVGNANFLGSVVLSLGVPLNEITSWGWFADPLAGTGMGLADKFGPVTSANFFGNVRVRPGAGAAVASIGVTNPSVVALANGSFVTPTSVAVSQTNGGPDIFSSL